MANVKNFGLIGTGSTIQLGKAGPQVVASSGQFYFKNAAQTLDVAIEAASMVASTGGVSLSSNSGTFSIGGDTTLSRAAAGVFQFNGTAAVIVPSGTTAQQPGSAVAGMFRYNSTLGFMEYFNGTAWTELATGGGAVNTANNLAGGTAGQVPYQSAPGVTAFTGPGTAGQVLTSNGTSAPTYTSVVNSFSGGTTGLTPSTATTGAVVLDGVLNPANGGTGVNNGSNTITLGGNMSTAGTFSTTVGNVTLNAASGGSNVTLPASGTLATVDGTVSSFKTTLSGLTPSTDTTGAVTLAGTLGIASGGTGASTAEAAFNALAPTTTAGDLIYFDGTTNTRLAVGSAGQALVVASGEPSWANIVNSISTSGTGISTDASTGAVTVSLNGNLQSIAGLSGTGFVVQTAANTFTERNITGTSGNIVVTNGNGVASSPTIDLAEVTQGSGSNFVKVTLDGYGRVTGNTAVSQSDLTGLISTYYLPSAGGTMTGNITMSGGSTITGLPTPVNSSDAASKGYVDSAVSGLTWKTAVAAATTGPITLDNTTTAVDGYTVQNGDRILVKNQTTGSENGIYIVSTSGAWTRATDVAAGSNASGIAVFVEQGSTLADTGWVQTADPAIVGTDALTFVQFSGAGSYTAGTGLTLTGNTFSVNLGAGIAQLPTNEVGIDLYDPNAGALILTQNGTSRSTDTASTLYLLLDGAGGLAQTASGLKINTAGVTNSMLANSTITLDADTGTQSLALGGTLMVQGTSNRITTAVTDVAGVKTYSVDISPDYVGQSSITTVGTIGTGTWQGSIVGTAYGGTGLNASGATNGQLLIGNGAGGFNLSTITAGTGVSVVNGAGSITISNTGVTSFSGGTTGLTPSTATTGAVTLGGTLGTANGGTGLSSFSANQVFYAGSTSTVAQSANFTFDGTSTLTVGGAGALVINGASGTISTTATNGNINLVPNGTGSVVVGSSGADGTIASDPGQDLILIGDQGLKLQSNGTTTGNGVNVALDTGTAAKLSITGPSASNYATGLAANDIPNVQYVTDAIASGASSGAIKSYTATVPLNANGTTNIGSALPANAIVLQVKVNVTVADTGATLAVGTSGTPNAYMTTAENDPQTVGMYIAETYVLDATGSQVIATVASSAATANASCTVLVEYKVA